MPKKEEEDAAIAAHHLPIKVKRLEAQVVSLTTAIDVLRETLRDRTAMAALTGLLSNNPEPPPIAARDAYEFADAMMEARKC